MAESTKKAPAVKDAGIAAAIGQCLGHACKTKPSRFGFCDEHYDQFKFGLIKKTGENVPDYDKKFEHYQAYKKKRQVA